MPSSASIPRFLLPQTGAFWRSRLRASSSAAQTLRNTSSIPRKVHKDKPLILEKPAKFNPPSHGAKLRSPRPRYSGPVLSAEDIARQSVKKYPNTMAPEGSFAHWFIHNKRIHMIFTLGTLATLALTVFITNFQRNSPFVDMIPPWKSFFMHPIQYLRTLFGVLKLDNERVSAETQEKRKRRVDDIAKRAEFRKSHGLDQIEDFGGWTVKSNLDTSSETSALSQPAMTVGNLEKEENTVVSHADVPLEEGTKKRRPVKKWLGIW